MSLIALLTLFPVISAAPAGQTVALGQISLEKKHRHIHMHSSTANPKLQPFRGSLEKGKIAEAFPLAMTRVSINSAFGAAQQLNTQFLRMLSLDRLLFQFRFQSGKRSICHLQFLYNTSQIAKLLFVTIGLSTRGVQPYGGWENPNYGN